MERSDFSLSTILKYIPLALGAAALAYGLFLLWMRDPNYLLVVAVGGLVGSTELMSRYRDAPFAPLISAPGLFYVGLNAIASALAYFLLGALTDQFSDTSTKTQIYRVLLASVGAMAFFRSGLFTIRLGDDDVPVGPNLILQVLLAALDRTYDRIRAAPRSREAARIMAGVSFELAAPALPSFCFNLMQNVSDEEQDAVADELAALDTTTMNDESRTLILGLTLVNVVGTKTLQEAVDALGGSIRGFKKLSIETLANMARQRDSAATIANLANVVRALCPSEYRHIDAKKIEEIDKLGIDPDSKVVLLVHALIRHYGEDVVNNALASMMVADTVPPAPGPPPPPPPPAAPPTGPGEDDPVIP